jgi:hypothetical protein
MNNPPIFRHLQLQNNWKPSFDFISVHGLDGTWKPRIAVYNPGMAIYFLSSLLFLGWGSVGRVLMVRSDYKHRVQMKGSSVDTWLPHRPVALLWFSPHHLHHLPSSSPLEKESADSCFRLSICLFLVRSTGCLQLFSNFLFGRLFWPQGNWSSLMPDYHENHLIWEDLEPGSSPWLELERM